MTITDTRGKEPNFVLVGSTLQHMPTGLTVTTVNDSQSALRAAHKLLKWKIAQKAAIDEQRRLVAENVK